MKPKCVEKNWLTTISVIIGLPFTTPILYGLDSRHYSSGAAATTLFQLAILSWAYE
jgi:hypothetical protein